MARRTPVRPSPAPASTKPTNASATVDNTSAMAAVAALEQQLASLTEQLNKGSISVTSDRSKTLDLNDIGGDEAWQSAILRGDLNAKTLMDDALIDLSVARKQVIRTTEATLLHQLNLNAAQVDNIRNQNAQNNATTMNGIDKLQNIDIREAVGAREILDRITKDVATLQAALKK